MPLPLTGETAGQCETWVAAVVEGEQEVELLWDGEHLLGAGDEFVRPLSAVVDSQPVSWQCTATSWHLTLLSALHEQLLRSLYFPVFLYSVLAWGEENS